MGDQQHGISYSNMETRMTFNDRRCYQYFEKLLQNKALIQNGFNPNYAEVCFAIQFIDQESDYLKLFLGYKRAKRMIIEHFNNTREE